MTVDIEKYIGRNNYTFLFGAQGYGVGDVKTHKCARYGSIASLLKFSPKKFDLFRTIEGRGGHILFVLDSDAVSLNNSLRIMRFVNKLSPGLVKFSGNRGFHYIQKIDDTCVRVKKICNDEGVNLYTFIQTVISNLEDYIKKKIGIRKDLELFDIVMGERNRLIRSFSLHSRTGKYSIPIKLNWSVEEILKYSEKLAFYRSIRHIPKFGLTRFFFSSDNKMKLKKYRVRARTRSFIYPSKNFSIDNIKLPLCLSCIKNYKEPPHTLRFYLTCYLMHTYFLDVDDGRNKMHGFILKLVDEGHWDDYKKRRTSYQINQIFDKNYIMCNCETMRYKGFCNKETMKNCPCDMDDNVLKFYQLMELNKNEN